LKTNILVVNAGSTGLKLDLVGTDARSAAIASLDQVLGEPIRAVAHRIVHGGPRYREPVVITDTVHADLAGLAELAPLHNTPALAALDDCRARFPGVPQVAVFDTGFHASMPPEATVYAVPRAWREHHGIRRYGFHGLSIAWSVSRAAELTGVAETELRGVVCHLGGGSSVTAIAAGRSVDTTMGFTPLEGVPMTTRAGSVDPGAVVYMLRRGGITAEAIEHDLEHESGMRALAGGSGDMRDVERLAEAGDGSARLAFDHYTLRVAGAVAAMSVSAAGLDTLVFTGGIGERSPAIRAAVCDRLGIFGVEIDAAANSRARADCDLSAAGARVRSLVVHAREELVAAELARGVLA
jgi:acetate kinase